MNFRGAVVSVGGTADPIIFSLKQHQPAYVLFLVSEESANTVEKALQELGYVPQYELLKVHNEGNLAESYEKLRKAIPQWLKHRALAAEDVYVDMTGGTKPMSAALTPGRQRTFWPIQLCWRHSARYTGAWRCRLRHRSAARRWESDG
jgi:hypothetical protein